MFSRQSPIDFWLVSKCLNKDNISVNIFATPLTDHNTMHIYVKICSPVTGRVSYWKLNSSILKRELARIERSKLITYFWNKAVKDNSFRNNWELFKYKVGMFVRKYSSTLAKARRTEEEGVITGITALCKKAC